jgi:adenine-specific DNA-methyltransferase
MRKTANLSNKDIEQYEHTDKQRANNPPAGLVTTEPEEPAKKYAYDPHIDPELQFDSQRSQVEKIIDNGLAAQTVEEARAALGELKRRQEPYLNWAGKAEHTSFEVPTVSLHVHERIDPRTIIEAVRSRRQTEQEESLFASSPENPPLREAVEFYKHRHGWSNRMVAGDSLLVMNSLLQKEGMAGQVQMIYIDPPYGITYGSNFQPFVNKRDVKDGRDEDLTQEPEMIKAFRDTWELGIHSYLTYLRDRLLLARDLLSESGSVFVQISDENVHRVRDMLDEVFGTANFVSMIPFKTTSSQTSSYLPTVCDFVLWYAKSRERLKFHQLYLDKEVGGLGGSKYTSVLLPSGQVTSLSQLDDSGGELPKGSRLFRLDTLTSQSGGNNSQFAVQFQGDQLRPRTGYWKTNQVGMERLSKASRIAREGRSLAYVRYFDDFPVYPLANMWEDFTSVQSRADRKVYVVQTGTKVILRCILMTTDPGDLVLDPTCGSGTSAVVAEQWGRRWITCDTSRVAITLAKQRLMTTPFDYYVLAQPHEGIGSGLKYLSTSHVGLHSIVDCGQIDHIYEEQHPAIEKALAAFNKAAGTAFREWEVPREPMKKWSDKSREYLTFFWVCRDKMQTSMDAAIQRSAEEETLYDQPLIDKSCVRVTGPFTLEAVPAPAVKSPDAIGPDERMETVDNGIARMGETQRQAEWRDQLLKTGIRGKSGQYILFSRLEPLPGTRFLQVDGETRPNDRGAANIREGATEGGQRVVVCFGPEHAPLGKNLVEHAVLEAQKLAPRPMFVVFAAFQFDPEAARDIDETNWPGVTLLKVQMNPDLLTEDLKKKRASDDSFWLIGQPDVHLTTIKDGKDKGKIRVEVNGFDYYNTRTGKIESGGSDRIAMWMLDPDYDGRSLFPRQVFFPMAGDNEGWSRLARTLRAQVDPDLIERYRGTVSLPFEPGEHKCAAVKIVDDRGIESLRLLEIK